MPITHSSTAKQEEKQVERGSCQTLQAILVTQGEIDFCQD